MIKPVRSLVGEYEWWRLTPRRDLLTVDGEPNGVPTKTDLSPPQCAVIPGELAIVYIPRGNQDATLAIDQPAEGRYAATWYDPRTGRSSAIAPSADGGRCWTGPKRPAPADEDWALILSGQRRRGW